MSEMKIFLEKIRSCWDGENEITIDEARKVVKEINEFLYTNYPGIGDTFALGSSYPYFSDFHRYWEENHKEILNIKINETKCESVADVMHGIFVETEGQAFTNIWNMFGLSNEEVCRVRMLTANQDFRGSRSFEELAKIYEDDPTIFDLEKIQSSPDEFIKDIGAAKLSQNDKRISYAKNLVNLLIEKETEPFAILEKYNNSVMGFKDDLLARQTGYGNKKADMFIRDMIVLNIWNDVTGFEEINVASDVNTMKVALRTGIIETEIPLVSSFLDIFCYQYGDVDDMNASAWRKVWEIWKEKYPTECIKSPCLMDYFIYDVVGKQFCKPTLAIFKCDECEHTFKWHSGRNKTCQVCHAAGIKNVRATKIASVMPCMDEEGSIAIQKSKFVSQEGLMPDLQACPFKTICDSTNKRFLEPPKSISILGQTGWTSAYAEKDKGGGGLMS